MKPYPRIEAYMKFPGDVRKLKSLDIELTYVRNLEKNKLLFDNLIEEKERFSENVHKSLYYQRLIDTK